MKLKNLVPLMLMAASGCHTNKPSSPIDLGGTDGGPDFAMPDMASNTDMPSSRDMATDNHQPLNIVPNAVPTSVDGGVDYYELHVKAGTQQALPGAATPIWGFNGQWPGPTIQATMGRAVHVRVFNDLPSPEPITIHNHGHNSQAAYDGHPSNNTILQGSSYQYQYSNLQQGGPPPNYGGAGTYFLHDHEMGLTAPHVYKGIEAFYIIHPAPTSTEAALNLPSGDYDIPLMIQDRTFNADNSLATYSASVVPGFSGGTLVVNGTAHPYLSVSRRKYRFRLLNASSARTLDIGLSTGTMYQISTDGGLLPTRLTASKLPLAPAERIDIVIDFSQYQIGQVVTLTNDDPFAPSLPEVLQFRVASDATDTSSLPTTLNSSFVRYTATTPTPTPAASPRAVVFDFANGEWRMNMQTYDPSMIEFPDIKIGSIEEWVLTNNSSTPHPFHQHLVQFQIISVCPTTNASCGFLPPLTQQGWKDTVLVPASSQVVIKMPFYYSGPDPFVSGSYVFHCHNLDHEDHAMMLQEMVSP